MNHPTTTFFGETKFVIFVTLIHHIGPLVVAYYLFLAVTVGRELLGCILNGVRLNFGAFPSCLGFFSESCGAELVVAISFNTHSGSGEIIFFSLVGGGLSDGT